MRRILSVVIGLILLLSLAACAAAPAETEQADVSETVSVTPEPSPTEEPTPTPNPVPESVQSFSAEPRAFILNAVCAAQFEIAVLLSPENTASAFNTASPDLIQDFRYDNFIEDYDSSDQPIVSNETAQYDFSLTLSDPSVDWSDDFNYNVLAQEIGLLLNLEYGDETITTYSDDGEESIEQKWARGSDEGYSTSWLYLDDSYTHEGTARLTYCYPGQNSDLNTLIQDSFEMAALPFFPILETYDHTSSAAYSPNFILGADGPSYGNVGVSWRGVTADSIGQLQESLSADSNATAVTENDFYHSYTIGVESDYFDCVTIEYYEFDSFDPANPVYIVNCCIFYK